MSSDDADTDQPLRRSQRKSKPVVRYSDEEHQPVVTKRKKSKDSDDSNGDDDQDSQPKKKKKSNTSKANRPKAPEQKSISHDILDQLTPEQKSELLKLKVDNMRVKLGDNKQIKSGNKIELQCKIADCIINGAIPPCPKCDKFPLRLAEDEEIGYFCPDLFRNKCDFKSKTVERIPWVNSEGSNV